MRLWWELSLITLKQYFDIFTYNSDVIYNIFIENKILSTSTYKKCTHRDKTIMLANTPRKYELKMNISIQ
jgi:hypothetical protein